MRFHVIGMNVKISKESTLIIFITYIIHDFNNARNIKIPAKNFKGLSDGRSSEINFTEINSIFIAFSGNNFTGLSCQPSLIFYSQKSTPPIREKIRTHVSKLSSGTGHASIHPPPPSRRGWNLCHYFPVWQHLLWLQVPDM